jgi:glycosyltransferase 2 family protein
MRLKHYVSFLGSVVVGISLYFIAMQLSLHKSALLTWRPDAKNLSLLGLSTLVYVLANYLLAFAWICLLRWHRDTTPTASALIGIYGKSQIAKYMPGNIMHLAGRHILGKAAGMSHKVLTFAAVYEMAGLLSVALLIGLAGLQWHSFGLAALKWLPVLSPILIVAYFIFPLMWLKLRSDKKMAGQWYRLALPLLIYFGFFLLAGLALLLLFFNYAETVSLNLAITALTAFAIAWSAGFVTPGSPSGIGIRESMLIILLSPLLGADIAVSLSLLVRLVTVAGDILFMLLTGAAVYAFSP